jgi:hypothetical protein
MASEIKITINAKGVITGTKDVEAGFDKLRSKANQTQSDMKKALNVDVRASIPQLNKFSDGLGGVSNAFSTLKNLAVGGLIGSGVITGISAAVGESVKLENALIGVESVAKSFGQNTDAVKKAVLEFTKDGLVGATEAALAFKQVLSTGTDLPTAIKLLNSLKDTAAFNRQAFYSLGEAVVATTEGIKNGNSVRADAVGVTKNLSVLEKEYAASIGKTVGKLTDAEKMQARVTGFIREGAFASGDAAKLLDTYSGSMSGLSTAFDRALAKMGSFITQSGIVRTAIQATTSVLQAIGEDNDDPELKIKRIRSQLAYLNKEKVGDTRYRQNLDEELRLLEQQVNNQKRLTDAVSARKQVALDLKKTNAETAKADQEADEARLKRNDTLRKQLVDAGKTELQTLQDVRSRRLADAGSDANLRLLIEKDFQKKKLELEEKGAKESSRIAKSSIKEMIELQKLARQSLQEYASNPFGQSDTVRDLQATRADLVAQKGDGESEELFKAIGDIDKKISSAESGRSLGVGAGIANSIVGGKEGAKGLVSGLASAGLDMIAPGLGQAAKPLLDAFTQGPEAVKSMVKEFAQALPDVVAGFIEAIPVFIETLADEAPMIIERLAEKAPEIISKLVEAAPRIMLKLQMMMPKIAISFATELIRNIPRIVNEAARAIYNAIVDIFNGMGDFFGDANDWLGDATGFKFARGGEVPSGAGTAFKDTVPAMLMGGERVLDRQTNTAFKRFVEGGGSSGGSDVLLARIISLLEMPMIVQSQVKVQEKAFADIILNMSRTGQRILG